MTRLCSDSNQRPSARVISAAAILLVTTLLTACEPPKAGGSGCAGAVMATRGPGPAGSTEVLAAWTSGRPKPKPKPDDPAKKRKFNCTKQNSKQWQKLRPYQGSVRTNGKAGKTARYYEWDHTHNDIEVYGPGPGYKHLGSMDPVRGSMYKGPVKGRDLRGKLK